jgi:glutamate/tyrosine decarboxylase-like PLP-dependent enzyme
MPSSARITTRCGVRSCAIAKTACGLFAWWASTGTVSTSAFDPLWQIAALCGELDLWLRVDGAYGALGILHPEAFPPYRGLERADSLALDPHKGLRVPVECGCVLVRDGALIRWAFSLVPPYIRTEQDKGFGGLPWFSEFGVPTEARFPCGEALDHARERRTRMHRRAYRAPSPSGPASGVVNFGRA